LVEQAADLAARWPALAPAEKRPILRVLVARVDVRTETVDITLRPKMVANILNPELHVNHLMESASGFAPTQVLSVPAQVKRAGMEMKLLIQGEFGPARREPDRSLMRLLGQARRFSDLVMNSKGVTITAVATNIGVSRSYFTRVFRLSFLAPEITKTIVQGRQPSDLTANKLILASKLPSAWSDQHRYLGLHYTPPATLLGPF
jgi:site-specific DNA recombinase